MPAGRAPRWRLPGEEFWDTGDLAVDLFLTESETHRFDEAEPARNVAPTGQGNRYAQGHVMHDASLVFPLTIGGAFNRHTPETPDGRLQEPSAFRVWKRLSLVIRHRYEDRGLDHRIVHLLSYSILKQYL